MSNSSKTQNNVFVPYYESMRDDAREQHKSDLAALDRNKNVQMQEAAINSDLLKKYLPQMNQMSGLSGLGVSESANIDALSRYQNTVSGIEQGYSQSKSELDRYLRSDLAQINANERSEKITRFDNAYKNIGSGIFGTTEDLSNYLASMGYAQGSDEYNELYNYGTSVIDAKESGEIKEDEQRRYDEAALHIQSGGITDQDTLDKYLTYMGYEKGSDKYNALSVYASPYLKKDWEMGGNTTSVGTVSDTGDTVYVPVKVAEGNAPGGFNLAISAPIQNKDELLGIVGNKDEGEVFAYDGVIYIFKNDVVYALTDKNGSITSRTYSDAYKYLANGTTPETRPMDQMPTTGRNREKYTDKNGEEYSAEYYTGVNQEIIKGASEAEGEIFKYGSDENAELYILKDGFIFRLYPKK